MSDDEPITDAELDAMAQRANAASKPPWQSFAKAATASAEATSFVSAASTTTSPTCTSPTTHPSHDADLDFIAVVSQDIPRLIAEVKRLRT
jgi:hypothetical protein